MATTDPVTHTPSEIARAVFHRIFNERDLSDPSAFWTDRSVDYFLAAGQTVRGATALAAWFEDLFAAVPDWHLEIENTIDDGDRQVVVQWHATGTMTGAPFLVVCLQNNRLILR